MHSDRTVNRWPVPGKAEVWNAFPSPAIGVAAVIHGAGRYAVVHGCQDHVASEPDGALSVDLKTGEGGRDADEGKREQVGEAHWVGWCLEGVSTP